MEDGDLFGKIIHFVVGTCQDMCPSNEIELRIREGLVHWLEGFENPSCRKIQPIKSRMVKEYMRPAAGKVDPRPYELRPAEVLQKTVNYLLGNVAVREDAPWESIYDFVFDRLRAVRQDMVIQNIGGNAAIDILQKIVRFHIYAGYRLCTKPISVYDPKINEQHTQECLKRLLYLYRVVSLDHPHREEFESLYLLFNLGETEALMHYYDLPEDVRSLPLLKQAYEISMSHILGNFVRCLRLLKAEHTQHEQLFVCAASRHIRRIQSKALKVLSYGYNSKAFKYPVSKLCDLLWIEDINQAVRLCQGHGLEVKDGQNVIFSKTAFRHNEKVKPCHFSRTDNFLKVTDLASFLLHDGIDLKGSSSTELNSGKENLVSHIDYWDG